MGSTPIASTNKKNVDLLKIDVLFFFATRFATRLLFEII